FPGSGSAGKTLGPFPRKAAQPAGHPTGRSPFAAVFSISTPNATSDCCTRVQGQVRNFLFYQYIEIFRFI
ncbi:hypothetical protein, partial [Azotobacter vinelandii]